MSTTTKRPTELRVVGSNDNHHGIEVRHARGAHGLEHLHAYRCGELVATRLVERHDGRAIGGCVSYEPGLDRAQRDVVRLALDEGVRVLRDGLGLAEAS